MDQGDVTINRVEMSRAAALNVEEVGVDPQDDVEALLNGTHTRESLLARCLDGADDDRVEGWREYVVAVAVAARTTVEAALRSGEYDADSRTCGASPDGYNVYRFLPADVSPTPHDPGMRFVGSATDYDGAYRLAGNGDQIQQGLDGEVWNVTKQARTSARRSP